jgi:hypothetical protein
MSVRTANEEKRDATKPYPDAHNAKSELPTFIQNVSTTME